MSAVDEVRVLQDAMNQKSYAFAAIKELAERVKALEAGKSDLEHDYCTCGETETWFDRSFSTDSKGNVLQDMCERCVKCGKEKGTKAPAPDLDALVDKYFGQLTKATFDLDVPVMQAFKYVLRAFAEELGYKP